MYRKVKGKTVNIVLILSGQPRIFLGRTDAETEAPIFGHPIQSADSLEKTLMLGKFEGRRRRHDS